jgi:hypothetical protein
MKGLELLGLGGLGKKSIYVSFDLKWFNSKRHMRWGSIN